MKPGFALSLSAEGIVLLHRAAGGWRNVGRVPLDAADLPTALAELREHGDALEPGSSCKLIIPNDQIRYLSIDTGTADLATRQDMARAALEGATPYAVDELTFDLSEDGDRTHVAAVAQETLAEAESFALDNGFKPASFVAVPGDAGFLGEPFFGKTASIGTTQVEPDGIAVVDVGPADVAIPKSRPQPNPETPAAQDATQNTAQEKPASPSPKIPKAPSTAPPPPPVQDPKPQSAEGQPVLEDDGGPIAGFSSRRRKATSKPAQRIDAPALTGASRTAPTEATRTAGAASNNEDSGPAAGSAPLITATNAGPGDTAGLHKGIPATPIVSDASKARGPDMRGDQSTQKPLVSAPNVTVGSSPQISTGRETSVVLPSTAKTSTATVSAIASTARRDGSTAAKPAETLARTKGKPRHLGLVLTVVLILVMAAVAALALLSDSGIFTSNPAPQHHDTTPDSSSDVPSEAATTPPEQDDPPPPPSVGPPGDAPLPVSIAPQVSALSGQGDPGIVELNDPAQSLSVSQSEPPSSTDQAVLDALQGQQTRDAALAATQNSDAGTEATGLAEQPIDTALEQAALYAATGIWHLVPEMSEAPALISLDDIYIASIDNSDLSQDAVALPATAALPTDPVPDSITSPAAAGSEFILDSQGLVIATPEGTLNPDGVMVYLGRPQNAPPPSPDRVDPAVDVAEAEAENARLERLSRKRPRPRPSDLVERAERALLGGLSRAELAQVRPRARPASLKTVEQESGPVSDLAIKASVSPRARPTNFANLVDRAQRSKANRAATSATASTEAAATIVPPQTVSPSIPSSASVARQATVNNAINLRRLNLIGISGTPANRRALIRLPSGRYKKIQVGDRIDGGTVVAIGESQLQYQKRGTNTTLKIPGS